MLSNFFHTSSFLILSATLAGCWNSEIRKLFYFFFVFHIKSLLSFCYRNHTRHITAAKYTGLANDEIAAGNVIASQLSLTHWTSVLIPISLLYPIIIIYFFFFGRKCEWVDLCGVVAFQRGRHQRQSHCPKACKDKKYMPKTNTMVREGGTGVQEVVWYSAMCVHQLTQSGYLKQINSCCVLLVNGSQTQTHLPKM